MLHLVLSNSVLKVCLYLLLAFSFFYGRTFVSMILCDTYFCVKVFTVFATTTTTTKFIFVIYLISAFLKKCTDLFVTREEIYALC